MCAEAYREYFLTLLIQLVIINLKQNISGWFLPITSFRCPNYAQLFHPLWLPTVNTRLISYCIWTKAHLSHILHSDIPHVHCRPVLCVAESSLRSHIKPMWMWKTYWWGSTAWGSRQEMPLIRECAMARRQLIKHPFMCYQAPKGSRFIP